MKNNHDVKAHDFNIMKKDDQRYGEKAMKAAPKKEKPKHRTAYNKMSVQDVMSMNDDYDLEMDYVDD